MKAYDLDGVIDTGRYHPDYTDVIITGNTPENFAHVMKVMKEFSVACPVYFMPYDAPNDVMVVAKWKAEIINRLRAEAFYEDDPKQVELLRMACPNARIIQV